MKSVVEYKEEMERIKSEIAQNRAKKEMLEKEILKITGVKSMKEVSKKLADWEKKLDEMENKLKGLLTEVEEFINEYNRASEEIN